MHALGRERGCCPCLLVPRREQAGESTAVCCEQLSHSSKHLSTCPVFPVHSPTSSSSCWHRLQSRQPTPEQALCRTPTLCRVGMGRGWVLSLNGGCRIVSPAGWSSSWLGRWSKVLGTYILPGGVPHLRREWTSISGRIRPGKDDSESCPRCKSCPKKELFHQLGGKSQGVCNSPMALQPG